MRRFTLAAIAGVILLPAVLGQANLLHPLTQARSARSSTDRRMHGTGTTWMPSSRTRPQTWTG
jgi:hypothetical protein